MKLLYIALLFGISLLATAQNTLQGTVKDSNNKVIENATISIAETNQETITDAQGVFIFKALPKGKLNLSIVAIGYKNYTSTIYISQNNNTPINCTLEFSNKHIDEIIVSTVFNKIQSENVMKVEHYKAKDLKQMGATTLIEGIANIPGVSQISTGTSIGKPVIRGLSGNRVLVYTQGVRLENQQFGDEHGLGLNDNGIESVEVIKGPASLLYGSDALGGVLYFNPEKFAAPNTYIGSISQKIYTNTQGISSSFGLKSSATNWKFTTNANHTTHADYSIFNNNRVTNTRYQETDSKTGLSYAKGSFSTTFRYNINHLQLGIPEAIAEQTTTKTIDYPRQRVTTQILSLHNTLFLSKSKIDLNLGYITNNRKEFENSLQPNLNMQLNTFNYDFKYYLPKLANLESIFGIQGMHQQNTNTGLELLIPNAITQDFAFLYTTNYQFKKNIIQAGIRLDNRIINTQNHGEIDTEGYFEAIDKKFTSYNASLGYKTDLTKNINLRANIASGFRAPNLSELTANGVHEGSNRYEKGNVNLQNEQNLQSDINIDYNNKHLEFFVNGFYNNIKNYIYIAPTGLIVEDKDQYQYMQQNAYLYGGEIGFHLHPHPIDWLHLYSSFESVTAKNQQGEYLPLIPANKINTSLKTEFKSSQLLQNSYALVRIENFFAQNKIGNFETPTHNYTLLNASIGGFLVILNKKIEINLTATNLLNTNYIAHLSRLKTNNIPNMGRNLGLEIAFKI